MRRLWLAMWRPWEVWWRYPHREMFSMLTDDEYQLCIYEPWIEAGGYPLVFPR